MRKIWILKNNLATHPLLVGKALFISEFAHNDSTSNFLRKTQLPHSIKEKTPAGKIVLIGILAKNAGKGDRDSQGSCMRAGSKDTRSRGERINHYPTIP